MGLVGRVVVVPDGTGLVVVTVPGGLVVPAGLVVVPAGLVVVLVVVPAGLVVV